MLSVSNHPFAVRKPGEVPHAGGTVNRYIYLLSAIFSRAAVDEIVDFNPCSKFEQEPETKRERYLMPSERTKLMEKLEGDLELRSPIEVSLGTGVRKITELLELRIENVNFSGLSIFCPTNGRDVEVRPNWFLLADTKGKGPRHRVMPMISQVRGALLKVIRDRTSGRVFDYAHTGVSASTLRRGFTEACKRAGIPFGQDVEGGLTWHDLRRYIRDGVTWETSTRVRHFRSVGPHHSKCYRHLRTKHTGSVGGRR